jgi:hypothetical protein
LEAALLEEEEEVFREEYSIRKHFDQVTAHSRQGENREVHSFEQR